MALKVKVPDSKKTAPMVTDASSSTKDKKLAFLSNLNKERGAGTVIMGNQFHEHCDFVSTGNLEIDWALGGGIPVGRMVEVFGPESSGKTTLCITTAREFQKKGYEVLLVDVEQAFDMAYAKKLGVNVDELAICQPKNGEEAMNITNESLKSGAFGLVIVDSIAALITQAELDKEIGDNNIGKQAKLMSDALKKLIISASNAGCTVMFTNQIRMKIGVMFGSPETTSGGEAMKFYATQRIDMRKRKRIMDGDVVIGQDTGVKIIKNKVAAPYREVEIALIYGEGFDDMSSLINMAEKANVLVKSGAWYAFKGSNVAQGKEKMRDLLLSNPELKAEVEELLKQNPPK